MIWDPDASSPIDAGRLYSRHTLTPYAGRQLFGCVKLTLLRGQVVFDVGSGFEAAARGALL